MIAVGKLPVFPQQSPLSYAVFLPLFGAGIDVVEKSGRQAARCPQRSVGVGVLSRLRVAASVVLEDFRYLPLRESKKWFPWSR